jgi:hypothetical protein
MGLLSKFFDDILISNLGVVSSAGRASRLHREGQRFDPVTTHHFSKIIFVIFISLSLSSCGKIGSLEKLQDDYPRKYPESLNKPNESI